MLASLSRLSIRQGNHALARTRLMECIAAVPSEGSYRSGAMALQVVAELAVALGEPERAVRFYEACRRVIRRTGTSPNAQSAEERDEAMESLRVTLGDERYEAALYAARATPFPFEFHITQALHWLEDLESRAPARAEEALGPGAMAQGTTAVLLDRAREGSATAKSRLVERYLEPLRQFARGRLPHEARDMMDTNDLVQVTMIRGIQKMGELRPRRKGGFFAYLRQILINQVRDEARRRARGPRLGKLDDAVPSCLPSPLEELLERESIEAFAAVIEKLPPRQREALALRIERGLSYREVAEAVGCPSPNAARMLVSRALTVVTKQLARTA